MEFFAWKNKLVDQKKAKKIRDNNSNWNFWFFALISFPLALVLTIIFWLSGIKTIFYEERGTFRHRWFRGYISVFFFLLLYIAFFNIILYVLLFLVKSLLQKKSRNQRKKAGRLTLIFLTNQSLINFVFILLWKQKNKGVSLRIVLISFLLIIFNSFFIHYFFSKPVMKLLVKKYPYYFPKFFHQETKLIMKVDGMEFKKISTTGWAITITLALVNFWILSQLFYSYLFKA